MREPVIAILAAGMGSRYGGLKQIDTVGNNGESIIDFTIYDAIQAGFKKVVLIIRKEHQEAFESSLVSKIRGKIEVEYAFQDINDIPSKFSVPEGREKPWGTTHALLACRNIINQPFMICNADDYYGKEAFVTMYNYLKDEVADEKYGMVGWQLVNTLTENGTVTRAICKQDNGYLVEIEEIQNIRKAGDIAEYDVNGNWIEAPKDCLASMNFWGFTPAIFNDCEALFENFLNNSIESNPMKCEHVIPTAIGELLKESKITMKVMPTSDKWFGVTYKEDKPSVVKTLQEYKNLGYYPFDLWK